jgi:hypothetical protein
MKNKIVFSFFPPDQFNTDLVNGESFLKLAADGNPIGNNLLRIHYAHTILWNFHVMTGGKADGWIDFLSTHDLFIEKKQKHPVTNMENDFTDEELSPLVTNFDRFQQPKNDKDIIYPQPMISKIAGIDSNQTSRIEKFMQDNGIRYFHSSNGKIWTTSSDMEEFLQKRAAGKGPAIFVN